MKEKFMIVYVARYWNDSRNYNIVVYKTRRLAEKRPHDWFLMFSRSEWRKMGCRVPKETFKQCLEGDKGEIMKIQLVAKEK